MSAGITHAHAAADKARSTLYRRRSLMNGVAITLACAAALLGLAFLGWSWRPYAARAGNGQALPAIYPF